MKPPNYHAKIKPETHFTLLKKKTFSHASGSEIMMNKKLSQYAQKTQAIGFTFQSQSSMDETMYRMYCTVSSYNHSDI